MFRIICCSAPPYKHIHPYICKCCRHVLFHRCIIYFLFKTFVFSAADISFSFYAGVGFCFITTFPLRCPVILTCVLLNISCIVSITLAPFSKFKCYVFFEISGEFMWTNEDVAEVSYLCNNCYKFLVNVTLYW